MRETEAESERNRNRELEKEIIEKLRKTETERERVRETEKEKYSVSQSFFSRKSVLDLLKYTANPYLQTQYRFAVNNQIRAIFSPKVSQILLKIKVFNLFIWFFQISHYIEEIL